MGTLKKFNGETQQWEIISTSDASVIGVRSEKLVPDGLEKTNIEEVLIRMQDSIDTLEGNVSWLATYGGGGSGGSGGIIAGGSITVNGQESGSTVVLDDVLNIIVQSPSAGLSWEVSIVANNKVVKTIVGNKITISKEDLEKSGINTTFVLSITAFNADTLTNIYWNGTVQIATIYIQSSDVNFAFVDKDDKVVHIDYKIGVLGVYYLTIDDQEIWRDSLTTNSGFIQISLKDIPNLKVGNNTIKPKLHINDEVYGENTFQIVLTADIPIIVCSTLKEEETNTVFINIGNNTIILVPYTVYFTSGTYKVRIYKDGEQVDYSTIYNSYNVTYNNASYALYSDTYGEEINLNIEILDSNTSVAYKKTYKLVTAIPEYNLLEQDLSKNTIFDFITFNGYINNENWTSGDHTLQIHNPNYYSQEIQTSDKSLRFQNASYGTIKINKNLVISNLLDFTLSVCYKADFHPDDDRTILQFGLADSNNNPSMGIFIKAHKLHIGANTLDLQDRELMNLTITYQQKDSNTGRAFVYIDSVLEEAYNIKVSDIYPGSNMVYLAAQEGDLFYTDVTFYRISLWNKCLNPYELLFEGLNNQARTHLIDGLPDVSYIENGLKRNFIENKSGLNSLLWKTDYLFNSNSDDFSEAFDLSKLISITDNEISFRSDISEYVIPIPIMLLDVSRAWSWTNFITPNVNLGQVEGCRMQYYDQTQNSGKVITASVAVGLQGTSTLADYIKNLDLTFDLDCVFIPKPHWLPEKTYTLKADIVDSSHSLNPSIGKFVNEEFGWKYAEDGSIENVGSWYPYSEQVSKTFIEAKSTDTMKKYFPKATLKHGVEGFPIFMILRFSDKIATLGIYQFILGRNSSKNLGYDIIKTVSGMDENPTYPYYKTGVSITTQPNYGYWLEFTENNSFPDELSFQELNSLENQKLTGAFWQNDDNYLDQAVDIKYTNLGSDAASTPSKFPEFKQFVDNIISLPVTNRRESVEGNNILSKNTFVNTQYPKYSYVFENEKYEWKSTGTNNTIVDNGDPLQSVLNQLHIESISKYFVIGMLLGLLDNFQKNMPMKFFKNGNTWEKVILGIYDTDSGCGGDNQGELVIPESMWMCLLRNFNQQLKEVSGGANQSVIGNSNKLWYLDSEDLNYTLTGERGYSIFAQQWRSLIELFKTKYNITTLDEIVDVFMDKYFIPQTESCGELLFNLTYFSKYINKYESNGQLTNQQNKFHGRRRYQIRRWLYNRVKFLDSMFTAMGQKEAIILSSQNINFYTGKNSDFYLTTNYPIVSRVDHEGNKPRFVFCDKNTETNVYWGDSSLTSQGVSHTVSYSDAIQKLGNDEMKLADIKYRKISGGALPYLTVLDLSNCTTLDGMNSEGMGVFKKNGKSELRIIDCSNTAKTTPIEFVLDLSSGFEKLQEVNVYNSCVSQLLLPIEPNIPLRRLNIVGAQLTSLTLDSQNLISDLDLTNCNKLINLTITNCKLLKSLTLGASQTELKNVTIASDVFETFYCSDNKSLTSVVITSSNLTDVTITKCAKLTSVTISGTNLQNLNLSECPNLKTLNITGNINSLETLNLSNTSISTIQYNGVANTEMLDLSNFEIINSFNIKNNKSVQYIQFKNIENDPIILNNNFQGCDNLKQIYGNVAINCDSTFLRCKNFSILGKITTYNGKNIISNNRVLHPTEISGAISNGKMKFIPGNKVTNMSFIGTSAHQTFMGTNCSIFDIYYMLYNIGNATNLGNMFRELTTTKFNWDENVDNSPHKNTFINCGKVTTISGCFFSICSNIRIFSPTHSENNVLKDDGLFSPLINCTNISTLFFGGILNIDRFIFRRTTGVYKFSNLSYLSNINNVTNDINTLNFANSKIIDVNISGNFIDIFKDTTFVTNINGFGINNLFINYDKAPRIPTNNLQTVTGVLCSKYACGNLIPENLFVNPANITKIHNSFIVYNVYDGNVATMEITSNIFNKFTRLQELSYNTIGDFTGTMGPFNGSGLNKVITQNTFPYDILNACKSTITRVTGLFQDVGSDVLTQVEIPGDLFKFTPKIAYCDYLFKNFKIPYTLTSESFATCTNLTSVSYMFANDDTSNIIGYIPKRLFYHGGKTVSNTYEYAVDLSFDPTEPLKDANGDFVLDSEGNYTYPEVDNTQTINISYFVPNTKIVNIEGCFQNCNASPYENVTFTKELNENYFPGDYYKQGDLWYKATKNLNQYTYAWEFDGINKPDFEGDNYDDQHLDNVFIPIQVFGTRSGTLNFMCAPDLLRYCKNNANITKLFYNSGHSSNGNIIYTNYPDKPDYGIKGRIPPYLLKPVYNATSINQMFTNCKQLSSYKTDTNVVYLIPKSFLTYTPSLTNYVEAFAGLIFPPNIDLNVFTSLSNKILYVEKIFYLPLFVGDTKIENIFPMTVGSMYRAFSVNNSDSDANLPNNIVRNQTVTFGGVFKKWANEVDRYVFDGYNRDTVKFTEDEKLRLGYGNYRRQDGAE